MLYQLKTKSEQNIRRMFFELNYDYMKQFLCTIKAKSDEDVHRRARMKEPNKKNIQT